MDIADLFIFNISLLTIQWTKFELFINFGKKHFKIYIYKFIKMKSTKIHRIHCTFIYDIKNDI